MVSCNRSVLPLPLLFCAALASCTAYVPDHADAAVVMDEIHDRVGGTFTLQRAWATALAQSPALLAATARARAAGAVIQPLTLQSEWRSGTQMLGVMLDPIEVLGLGQRGAAIDSDAAAAAAAAVELVNERWRVLGAIAEAYAVDAALLSLSCPAVDVRGDDYRKAGLAGEVAAARLQASQAAAQAEEVAIARERTNNLARLRALLGLPGHAELQLEHGEQPWRTWKRQESQLLQRPDLELAAARWQLADAEFRQAVANQYPSLMIGPEFPLTGGPLEAMAVLRVPLLQHGIAASARERRDAVRADLLGACLQVAVDATTASQDLRAAEAAQAAASAKQHASAASLRAATVAVQVEVDAFDRLSEAATMALEDTRMLREASVIAALAQVRAAIAHGWPVATATEHES